MPRLVDQRAKPLADRSFSVDGFSMVPALDLARYVFRASGVAVDTAGLTFGVELPRQALRTNTTGGRTASWMGPDEWLLQLPESETVLIEGQLTQALSGFAHSLVDVSHRDAAIESSGAKAAAALNAGCPLDLHPSIFAIGMCARTLLGKAQIMLWRTGPQQFHVLASRSFADYVWRYLEQAGGDLDNVTGT
jgi:sarcosine oxidase, subunit gamma